MNLQVHHVVLLQSKQNTLEYYTGKEKGRLMGNASLGMKEESPLLPKPGVFKVYSQQSLDLGQDVPEQGSREQPLLRLLLRRKASGGSPAQPVMLIVDCSIIVTY